MKPYNSDIQPLISIIVPIFNAEAFLESCIHSIAAQTYTNLEIIMINDGSSDNSGALCDNLAKNDSRIRVLHKTNGGVASARNAGLDIAQGEFIGFVDSDDTIELNMYECLYRQIIELDADICVCGYKLTDGYYEHTIKVPHEKKLSSIELWDSYLYDYDGYTSMMNALWNKLFRRNLIKSGSCKKPIRFDESYRIAEDMKFNIECIASTEKGVCFLDDILYSYNRINNPDSLVYSEGNYIKMIKIHEFFREILISTLPQKGKEVEKFVQYGCSVSLQYEVFTSIISKRKIEHKMTFKAVKSIWSGHSNSVKNKITSFVIYILPANIFYFILKLARIKSKKPKLLLLREKRSVS